MNNPLKLPFEKCSHRSLRYPIQFTCSNTIEFVYGFVVFYLIFFFLFHSGTIVAQQNRSFQISQRTYGCQLTAQSSTFFFL